MSSTKLSISVPSELLERADQLLTRPGEGRSGLMARVLAQKLANLPGEVRVVIAFVEEPIPQSIQPVPETVEEFFKEMEPYMAHAGDVDYSRDAMYSRKPGE